MSITPIFLFSLPRAGSTLLQRLLSQHRNVATEPEPWIALPLFFALKEDGVRSIYGHKALANAVNGFIHTLPNGRREYDGHVADFLRKLYTLSSKSDALYFLDKTPRYHLIVDDLTEAFPDAKYIFLWRNPLAVAFSMIQTWGKGKWNLYMFWVDLYQGIDSLVSSYNQNRFRAVAVRYEDLAETPGQELARITAYLDLPNSEDILKSFNQAKTMDVPGRGDPTGQYKYRTVSNKSLFSWKTGMGNPFRKAWSKKYLKWLGEERLNIMGYDFNQLVSELEGQQGNNKYLLSDIFRHLYGKIYCRYQLDEMRRGPSRRNKMHFYKY